MRSTRMLWGMLMFVAAGAVGACGEEGAAPMEALPSRDLDFVLPTLREPPPVNAIEEIENPLPIPDWMKDTLPDRWAEISGTTSDKGAFITDYHAVGWWNGSTYYFEYGLVGWGTGFTMDPNVTIYSASGATLVSNGGIGRSGDYLFPMAMWPAIRESIDTGQECGARANLSVRFEVRTTVAGLPFLRVTEGDGHSSSQARCPWYYGDAGGGGSDDDGGGGGGLKICYYDVWVDAGGKIVDWMLVSCHSYGPRMI